jgi:catechol 2,3-dioxygenase-like lactoylglutathione lyase family enzyme
MIRLGVFLFASCCMLPLSTMNNAPPIRRILETSLYMSDLAQAESFYQKVLGLELFAKETGRHVFFKCADQMLLLFNPEKTALKTETVPHGSHGPGHVAFAVALGELDPWIGRLKEHGVEIEKDIRWPGGGRSIYFRDPAGNCLELASPLLWRMPDIGRA